MVESKRRHEGLLAAWHAAQVIAFLPFTGRALDPGQMNPFREPTGAAAEIERVKRFIRGVAMAVMSQELSERR